jgi:hypothetical protein
MMEEEFYAVIKLVSGEEIFSKVSASDENNRIMLVLYEPITMTKIKTNQGLAYRMEPWIKNTTEDMFIIDLSSVITIVESLDEDMNDLYDRYLNKKIDMNKETEQYKKLSKAMGYVSNVNDARLLLEKIYRES